MNTQLKNPSRARIFAFAQLPPTMQRVAVQKVADLAVKRAEYIGEVWSESAERLAAAAKFEVYRVHGVIAGIWTVLFDRPPLIVAGTESHLRKSAQSADNQ